MINMQNVRFNDIKYNNFKVAIQRTDKNGEILNTDSKTTIYLGFNLFKYGAGTQDNPYVLDSEESLLNVKYYPNSYYALINDINILESDETSILSLSIFFIGSFLKLVDNMELSKGF